MTDNIETIIKALKVCTGDGSKGCAECPYISIFIKKQKNHLCFNELMKDALKILSTSNKGE